MLVVSAFFSGSEIAYVSADRLRIALKEQQGSKRAKLVAKFFNNPSNFLGTMLVGNNIALVIFGNFMETALIPFLLGIFPSMGEFGVLISITLLSTLVVLVMGEFIPKIFFRLYSTNLLLFFIYPLKIISVILIPFVFLMVKLSEFLLQKILGVSLEAEKQIFSRLDLQHFITENADENLDTELLENAMKLNEVTVAKCMIKRNEITAIDVNESISTLKKMFIEKGFSKILVYENDLDHIVGYVHHLQLLHQPTSIRSVLFDIPALSKDMPVMGIMSALMAKKASVAYVQHIGKTVGIITLEDILEEVFGEINDEHDKREKK